MRDKLIDLGIKKIKEEGFNCKEVALHTGISSKTFKREAKKRGIELKKGRPRNKEQGGKNESDDRGKRKSTRKDYVIA